MVEVLGALRHNASSAEESANAPGGCASVQAEAMIELFIVFFPLICLASFCVVCVVLTIWVWEAVRSVGALFSFGPRRSDDLKIGLRRWTCQATGL